MDFCINRSDKEKKFDDLVDLFDGDLYILTFAIKKYSLKDIRPSYILNYVETKNLDALNDSIDTLIQLNKNEIEKFVNIFSKVVHFDDYEIYKIVYDYEKTLKKEKQIQREYKYRIKQLEKHIEKNSLF